jgi:competence ComEA-like helix-hairpin-helix protein
MGRVWVTEVRPQVLRTGRENDPLNASYREEGAGRCSSVPAGDDGVLLAEIDVEVEATSTGLRRLPGDLTAINVIERDRPVLLTTRLLQEGPGAFPGAGGSGESSGPGPIELDDLTDVVIPASAPLTNRVLGWDAAEGRWEPVDLPSPTTDHGSMSGLEDDDHPQYLLVDSTDRSLRDHLNAGNFRLTNLAPSAADADAVRRDEVIRDGAAASRDLDGTYPDPIVVGLLERPLSTTPPTNGQVLQWSEDPQSGTGEWTPATVVSGGSSQREETDLTRIVALNYVHGQPSSLRFNFEDNDVNGIAIAFGLAVEGGENLVPGPVQRQTLTDRTVQVFTEEFDTNALGGGGAWRRLRLDFDRVIPLADLSLNDGLLVAGSESNDPLVDGVFLPIEEEFLEQIPNGLLEVVVRGDFILDAQDPPRAIDAEHVRGQRPTGDRPQGADAGVQGGLFESWVQYQMGVVNLNTATAEELRNLSGVGPELADRIVEERDRQGGFADVDALNEVRGIGRSLLTRLRGRVTTDPIDPRR